jgi:putative transposase
MLEYKSNWYGRDLIQIDRYFPSSKQCNCCGYKNNKLTLKDRNWTCPQCHVSHDRDFNAATNIVNEGIKLFKIKIGLSSPELTPLESTTLVDSLKKEKNVV